MIQPLNPKAEGHHTRKRFGQNFLQDTRVIDRIVRAVSPRAGDQVIEIGPGLGALTAPLLAETRRVGEPLTVVELDRDLAAGLAGRIHAQPGELQLIEADALRLDFLGLKNPEKRLRIVGNLPYNISTPLLFHLIGCGAAVHDLHFMLQKEVVARITATPGSSDYGRLSVMMQYHAGTEYLFEVPPGAFMPPPKVTSAVFRLVPHAVKPVQARDEAAFARLVAHVFTQRRKTLRSSLKGWMDAGGFVRAGVDPQARPEVLGVAELVALSDQYAAARSSAGGGRA
jgi:16S rRNA (adenine1518-N6/adenine1519-N6)-dimethyltransferase